MLGNYFKIAIRNLLRNKRHSFINIFGLAIGLTTCLAILSYLQLEWSYDKFHKHNKQIYRVKTNYIRNGELIFDSADNFAEAGPALKKEIPEALDFARLYNEGKKYDPIVSLTDNFGKEQSFKENKLFFADASLLDIFNFPLLKGSSGDPLNAPNTVIISASTAQKYFGDENPFGKLIRLNNNRQQEHVCTITGIFKDIPQYSHLQFDLLFSYSTLYGRQANTESALRRYEKSWSDEIISWKSF